MINKTLVGVGGVVSGLDAEVLQVREQDVDLADRFVHPALATHLKDKRDAHKLYWFMTR